MKKQSKSWQIAAVVLLALGAHLAASQETKPQPAPTNPPAVAAQTNPAPAQSAAAQSQPATNAQQRNIRFQFDGIPYGDVLERFAQMAGKPLVSDTNIQGTLTFNDPQAYNYQEALDTLNVMLSMKGVMLIEDGHFLRLAAFKEVPQLPLKILRGLDTTGDVRPGEVVTVVLQLRNLDAKEVGEAIVSMLSNAGSVAPLSRGKGLIVTDKLSNIQRIRTLLTAIDTESVADRQMRAYTLLHASGAVVSDLINRTFGLATAPKRTQFNSQTKQLDVLPPDPSDYVTAVYDDASRTLVLFGPRERIGLAEELISKFEDKEGGGGEVRIYYPQVTKADELAQMIRQAIPGIANPGDTASAAATKARVISDAAQNRLIVAAPVAGQVDQIEQLINRLDKPVHGTGTTFAATKSQTVQITKVFRPRSSEAASVAKILSEALSKRLPSGQTVATAQVTLEPNSQSVVVTGSPGDVQTAMDIVSQLETGSSSPRAQQTKFIDVGTVSEAKRIVPLVEQIYRSQVTDSISGQTAHAKIIADAEAGRLIVTASDDHLTRIEEIVKQLKSQKVQGQPRRLQILPLKNIRADAALASANSLITERMADKRFEDLTKPLLLPDASNNRLLVTATDEQFKEIQEMINLFDVTPEKSKREMLILPVQSKSATDLIILTSNLLAQIGETQTDAQLAPKLIPDPSGKQIIVLASAKDVERITNLVQQLDSASATITTRQFKGIELFSRKAAELTPLVQQLYQEQVKGQADPAGGAATVLAEEKNNRIMVSGSEAEIARVEAIIRQLDPQGAKGGKDETRVVRLKSAVAADLASLVEKTLNAQSQHVKVLIDPRSNSLVLSGDPAGVEAASQVIAQLDTRSEVQPRELRVLELKQGDANTVAPMVTTLFTDMVKEQRGPEYVPQTKIVPDVAGNRLIISGPKDELTTVASVVERLDQAPEGAGGARVFKLTMADATTVAPVVSNAMMRFDARNQPIRRVSVSADRESNSIIVSGSRTDLQDAQSIIERLDSKPEQGARDLVTIELKHQKADDILSTVTRLYAEQSAGQTTRPAGIHTDVSGSRLLVYGTKDQAAAVRQIVETLGQQQRAPKEARSYDFGKLAEAQRVLPVILQLYRDQAGSNGSAHMVSDGRTGRIIISARQDEFKQIDEIVARLQTAGATNQPSRETRTIDTGNPSDVQRLLPTIQQLYQDHWKDRSEADPADAQIIADSQTGRLIISGKPEHLRHIEILVAQVRTQVTNNVPRETRVYDLNTTSAGELATTVRTLYDEQLKSRPLAISDRAVVLPDVAANRLVVSGISNELAAIDEIVKQLDKVDAQTGRTRVFKLKTAEAEQVASVLSAGLAQVNQFGRNVPRITVGADKQNNLLIVSGEPKDLQAASVIVEQMDAILAKEPRQLRLIALKSGVASQLAEKVKSLYQDQMKGQPKSGTADALIIGEDASNRLIITAGESHLKTIEEIVSQLQQAGETSARELRVVTLQRNSAASVATMISQLFGRQISSQDPGERLIVTPSGDDRTLVLEAGISTLEKVGQLVKTLDGDEAFGKVEVRSYHLPEGNASELAPTLARLFIERTGASATGHAPKFEADTAANILMVAATAEQLTRIDKLIEELKKTAQVASEIRTFKLQHSEPAQIANVLETMLSEDEPAQNGERGRRRMRYRAGVGMEPVPDSKSVRVAPAATLGAVVVQGPPEKLALAEKLIQTLDKQDTEGRSVIQSVHLKKANAENLAAAVNQNIANRGPQSSVQRVTVTPVIGPNSLLINGPAEAVQEVMKIIRELDQESEDDDIKVHIYKLENGNAKQVSAVVEQLLRNVTQEQNRTRSGERMMMASVAVDERANALVISGTPAHFKLVEQLLSTLDKTPERGEKDVQFVWLRNAKAFDVALKLEAVFESKPEAERPFIEADTFNNSITIIGRRADIAQIQELVTRFDESTKDTTLQVRLRTLDRISAEQMARMLQNIYPQMAAGRLRIVEKLQPSTNAPPSTNQAASPIDAEVVVAVDKDANALILSGPTQYLDEIDRIISELSYSYISTDAEFRIFSLKEADPVIVARTLSELFKVEQVKVEQQQQAQRPGEVRTITPTPKVTIVAEPRTRSVIVRAKPTDFALLETLIKQLDIAGVSAQLEFRLVALTNAPPEKVAPLVQQMVTQLNVMRPGEPLTVTADPRTRGLLVVARDSVLNQVERMIHSLDVPAPFAEAEVLVLSLKKASAPQLSAVLQNMLKPGTSGELTAEARDLQEQIRRLKIQNGDGKTVLLDLTKPIKILGDPLAGGQGGGNRLILSSTPDNLKALAAVVEMMDSASLAEGVMEVKLFRLKHASATRLGPMLQSVFAEAAFRDTAATNQATAAASQESAGVRFERPVLRVERPALIVQADDTANIIIVAARKDTIPLIENIVNQLDIPSASGMDTIRVYPLNHTDPVTLQKVILDVYSGPRASQLRTEDKPNVSIDERTQSLIVCGNSKAFGIIDSLIMQLDRELPMELRDVRILMLQHADAPDVAASIQRLLDARVSQKSSLSKQQSDSMRALVIGEPRSNSLLISGSKDSYELIETLAKQLDLAPTALSGKIRLVALEYADARFVSTALANLFNQRYQAAKAPEVQRNRPIIVPDPRGNSLLIAAGIDDNLVIDELLEKLDKKLEDPALSLTLLPLRHNDAARVATTFESIFAARLKARTAPGQEPSPQDQVKIETDSLNNALVVSASKDNLETMKGLLEKMDIEPVAAEGVVQTFTLQFADAQRVATMLRTLVQQGLYRPGLTVPAGQGANSRREAMAVAVDPRSNTLIVSASPENLLVIREVLKQVDSKDLAETDNIRLYTLKHARASNLANVLQQFLRSKRLGESGAVNAPERAITAAVIPDDRVNTLLVTGTKENFDVIDRIIQQLDGEDAMSQMNFRVFPLKQATASKLQDTMQKLFVNRPPRVKGEPVDPITVVADVWVNALIVGAAVDDMTMVSALIERLDSDQAQLGLTVQVFQLAKADARRVAQTVQGLYREGTPGITLPVVVSPDERLNALVVSAGEGDLKRIGELVKKLDTDQVARVSEIRVFPLQYARAESLSTILNTSLNTKPTPLNEQSPNSASLLQFITRTEGGKQLVASALKEAVLITPDSRMNSLIVSAPVDYMDLLDQIIGRLDSGTPQSAKIKVFQLVNADARQMAELLMTLFRLQPSTQQNGPQRSIQYTLVKNNGLVPFSTNGTNGASGAPGNGNGETTDPEVELASATIGTAEAGALSVTIDPRTNSLLIGGTDHYVNLVAQVIQALDSSAGQERKSQVYRLKHAQATEVQLAVSSFLDQERKRVQQVLGQDAVGTALRMLEREVAVVAEPVSNTLLISANPRYFDDVIHIIEQLDQAQPQVLIQVLLAEVSLDATRSLGIEWDFQRLINAAAVGAGTSFGLPVPTPSLNTRLDRSLAVPPIPFLSADGFSATVTGDDYGFLIRALENDGRLEVLSRPQILTADNKPAEINVGQQVPFITDTRVTDQNAIISGVQYRTVGVSLRVTPRIGADGSVQMEISTTNSALTTSTIQITPTQAAPIINERRATTSVSVQSGQSILLAGLISTTDDTRSKKVPFLGDIPWFGMLFRSRSKLSDRKELLILLTPQVLLNAGQIAKLSDPNEVTREQLDRSQIRDQFKRDELQRQLLEPLFPDMEQKEPPKNEDKPKQEPKPQADPNSSPL